MSKKCESELIVDRRTPHSLYVEVGDMTVYIDNSTLEQIVDIFFDDDVPLQTRDNIRQILRSATSDTQAKMAVDYIFEGMF